MSAPRRTKQGKEQTATYWFLVDAANRLAIDPWDAKALIREGAHTVDTDTFADMLDGQGYPELASLALETLST